MSDPRAVHVARLAHFHGLLRYESEANARVIKSLDDVPPAGRAEAAFNKALGIFAHVQIARRVWLSRLEGAPMRPDEWFPAWNPDRLRFEARDLDRMWTSYLERMEEGGLDASLDYASADGTRFSSLISDVLTHVFNHSTYHRGQVASLVTQCGGSRAVTDYIAITRTPKL
ncbi:MAG: DinB family protein [Planctomycetota bacterium]|nr:DinB family protein [Planctomycetota bacterium]